MQLSLLNSNEFLSAILGAIIGGLFVLCGVIINALIEKRRDNYKDKEFVKYILQAFAAEITALWDRYYAIFDCEVEIIESEKIFLFHWKKSENYFCVFDQNAFTLGQIKNTQLRQELISVYIELKAYADNLKINNDLVRDYENFQTASRLNSNDISCHVLEYSRMKIGEFVNKLRIDYANLETKKSKLLRDIQDAIDNNDF